jgi:hypothetical protein
MAAHKRTFTQQGERHLAAVFHTSLRMQAGCLQGGALANVAISAKDAAI